MHAGQQRRISPRRRGVNRNSLLGAEAVQVMRAAGLGAGTTQAFTTERLHAHHGTDHVAVDVDVANMGRMGQRLSPAVDAGLDAQSQTITQRVDLRYCLRRITAPAHHLQHRAEDLKLDVGNICHFKGVRRNQICY